MYTLLLIAIPIISGLLVWLSPKEKARQFALISSVLSLALTIFTYTQFDVHGSTQFTIDKPWIEMLGMRLHVGIDGISLLMLFLSNALMPFIILSTAKDNYENASLLYGLILIMQGAMNGVFVALDMFLYYIFWELALIPAYFLVLWWGKGEAAKITFKFFLYTLFGSLFMLVAIIWMSQLGSTVSTDISNIYAVSIPENAQALIFFAFMLAYAIKIPVFPFHTWQPSTYTSAPAPATMLLSGVMLKMGLYSIIRWVIPVMPNAVEEYGHVILILAVVGVLYASAIAWVQKDIKTLFAYSSIAHVGLITAGIMTVSASGLEGSMLQMFAHGLNAVGLFYVAQILFRHYGHHSIDKMGGLRNSTPLFAGFFLVIMLASVALPLTNAFPGEFLLLNSVYQYNAWLCLIGGSGVILGAVYMFGAYKKIMLGEENAAGHGFAEISGTDKFTMLAIVVLIFVFGLFPETISSITDHSVKEILNIYQSKISGTI